MNLVPIYEPSSQVAQDKHTPGKASLERFRAGLRDCLRRIAAAAADGELCSWAALKARLEMKCVR